MFIGKWRLGWAARHHRNVARVSAKHLQAHLEEMCWRFDNRKNPCLFRDMLLKPLQSEHLEYKQLIAA